MDIVYACVHLMCCVVQAHYKELLRLVGVAKEEYAQLQQKHSTPTDQVLHTLLHNKAQSTSTAVPLSIPTTVDQSTPSVALSTPLSVAQSTLSAVPFGASHVGGSEGSKDGSYMHRHGLNIHAREFVSV